MSTTESGTAIAEVVLETDRLRRKLADDEEAHRLSQSATRRSIVELERRRALLIGGLSDEDRQTAENVLAITGKLTESAEGAFEAALTFIAEGGGKMLDEFVGSKRYEGFHQRCDCQYGYGPRHGSLVMSIGLAPEVRKRSPLADNGGAQFLEPHEREAAVRYLIVRQAAEADRTWSEMPKRDVDF